MPASALNRAASSLGCARVPRSAKRFVRCATGLCADGECARGRSASPERAERERWRESELPMLSRPGGRGESGGWKAGEPSVEDDGVSWTLSGRRRRGGTGGLGVMGWCSDLDRPSRAPSGELGEPGIGASCGFRSGCVGGAETSRRGGERDLDAARARNGLVSGGEPNGDVVWVMVRPEDLTDPVEDGGLGGLEFFRCGTGGCSLPGMLIAGLELRGRSAMSVPDELLFKTCSTRSFSRCSSALRETDAALLAWSEVWMSGLIRLVVLLVSAAKCCDDVDGAGGGGLRAT